MVNSLGRVEEGTKQAVDSEDSKPMFIKIRSFLTKIILFQCVAHHAPSAIDSLRFFKFFFGVSFTVQEVYQSILHFKPCLPDHQYSSPEWFAGDSLKRRLKVVDSVQTPQDPKLSSRTKSNRFDKD